VVYDPFPAWPHDAGVVRDIARHAAEVVPLLWPVDLYVLDREGVDRMNGYSNLHQDQHHDGDKWVNDPPKGVIVLGGKRIQPHPAMTRYLVGHETGHNVAYMINSLRDGVKNLASCEDLYREYAQARGLPDGLPEHGSGGTWHRALAEIFACDFRILVLHLEEEFWPHPGIPRPGPAQPGLTDWWDGAVARLGHAAAERAYAVTA
jgi:hypothetical protein